MDAHVKVGGSWKTLEGIHVKVSGAWKEVQTGYIKIGGAWKQFYTSAATILTGSSGTPNVDSDLVSAPGTASAGWTFNSSGDLTKYSGAGWAQPEWYGQSGDTTHQAPDQTYYIRATLDSGDAPDSGTIGSWETLSVTRTWYWETTGAAKEGVLKIEIASDAGGTDIVATGYYSGLVEVS